MQRHEQVILFTCVSVSFFPGTKKLRNADAHRCDQVCSVKALLSKDTRLLIHFGPAESPIIFRNVLINVTTKAQNIKHIDVKILNPINK